MSPEDLFQSAGLHVFERGWLSSNNVLFIDPVHGDSTLIDTGYATHADQTVALLRHALGGRSLTRIVNTHLHSDHCGGNAALQAAFDCAITIPAGEADKVDAWDEDALTYRATGQQCPRFRRGSVLAAGDELVLGPLRWQVIAVPGHDPESLALHQPDLQLLISADALWENGFGVVFPELEGERAFDDVRTTLDRLAALHVRWVIPGHGAPFQDFHGALARAHKRLDGFIADPAKHAQHAAKVLIKFHLLEVQQQSVDALSDWLAGTRFMRLTHSRHFGSIAFDEWCDGLIRSLVTSGALAAEGGVIANI